MPHSSDASHWSWLKRGFVTTRWSIVQRAGQAHGAADVQEICRLYWHPLYAFLRGCGHNEPEAQDYVQSFMVRLVHDGLLEKPDADRGRFRSFLLTVLLRHVSAEKRCGRALKRGGGMVSVPLDWASAESLRLAENAHTVSPEDTFRRSLALRLVDEALSCLSARYGASGQAAMFEELVPALEGPLVNDSYGEVAARLNLTEGAVRAAVFRLRERFREALRTAAATALTMPPGPALDAELREMFG